MGENIKKAREKQNITQYEASKLLKVSKSTYCNYEQGRSEPNVEMIKKIADLFHVTTDFLLGHRVGYLLDMSMMNKEQCELAERIGTLTKEECNRVNSYIDGLKTKK